MAIKSNAGGTMLPDHHGISSGIVEERPRLSEEKTVNQFPTPAESRQYEPPLPAKGLLKPDGKSRIGSGF